MQVFEKETMEEIDLTMIDHNGSDLSDHIVHQYGDDTFTRDGGDIIMEKKHLDWWCEWASKFEAVEKEIAEAKEDLDEEDLVDLEADLSSAWQDITELEDYPAKAREYLEAFKAKK